MRPKEFVFTGRHMLAVMVAFFGVVISVNVYMAWQATHSWSGLVVKNTYVASQEFNGKVAEAKALAATGITGSASVSGSEIRYELRHSERGPVEADVVTLQFKRPVGVSEDFSVDLTRISEGVFVARRDVPPGTWIVEASAARNGERILHNTERLAVPGAGQ